MINRDIASNVFCILIGVVFLIGSVENKLTLRGIPGPGFLPLIISIILISLGILNIFISGRKEKGRKIGITKEKFFPEKSSLKRFLGALAILFGFAIIFKIAGYLITVFLLMLAAGRIMESKRWRTLIIIAFLTSVASYLLFGALEVHFPEGVLEF